MEEKFSMDVYNLWNKKFAEMFQMKIKEAIMVYDADKTGKVDFALETAGGSIVSTKCSETYTENAALITIFGIPIWSQYNSPRTAIQPDVHPGLCWAFKGHYGTLRIKLVVPILVTGFTIEHIPVTLSPSGSIDSAPKAFSVLGFRNENDKTGHLFGKYSYNIQGEPLQYFPANNLSNISYSEVELEINSNHGNPKFTCIYRVRVHGEHLE